MAHDQRLASSFGAVATSYDAHRPDYAREAVQWAIGGGRRVLDLGAGTGKLTATLAELGLEVMAVEPDAAMLAQLRHRLPDVRALLGNAESIGLPDACLDAVVAGNAMHWFDMSLARPEIERVLVPGGTLAGLWNVLDDRVGWIAELEHIAGPEAIGPRDTLRNWRAATSHILPDGEYAEFAHGQLRTADSFAATLATRAGMVVMPDHEREARLAEVRAFLVAQPEIGEGEFTLPMLSCVLRARR